MFRCFSCLFASFLSIQEFGNQMLWVFFGNEMLMIYFSSFDVSFVFFYPSGRNLSDSNFYLFIDQSEN